MTNSYCVGLTGGIASGKSTLAGLFEELGVPVFYADTAAKACYADAGFLKKVKEVAGNEVFTESGELNRSALAALIFNFPDKRIAIQELVHPEVKLRYSEWLVQHADSAPYHIREAAILIESGTHASCDAVLLVCAPEEVRIQRAMQRDGVGEEEVRRRMQAQWSDAEKRRYASFCVENLSIEEMKAVLPGLHKLFLARAKEKSSL
jgi:dephospho-CoA kinase